MREQHSRHADDKLLIYTVLELTSIRESQFKIQYLWEAWHVSFLLTYNIWYLVKCIFENVEDTLKVPFT